MFHACRCYVWNYLVFIIVYTNIVCIFIINYAFKHINSVPVK